MEKVRQVYTSQKGGPRYGGGGGGVGSEIHFARTQNAFCTFGDLGPVGPRKFSVFCVQNASRKQHFPLLKRDSSALTVSEFRARQNEFIRHFQQFENPVPAQDLQVQAPGSLMGGGPPYGGGGGGGGGGGVV